MGTINKQYEKHTFKSFLSKYYVTIPMVQRDYAQGRTSIDVNRVRNRFLDAIREHIIQPTDKHDVMKLDFVYGEKENVWSKEEANKLTQIIVTPLDGQQRLTTLYLLHWYAAKRKESLAFEKYSFLEHFSYDIRPSSRDFCARLLRFTPSFESSIKDQLIDQYWFMGDWHDDPTIISMLVMIDAINDKFSDVNNLWDILTGDDDRIVFYFLPLSENGLSDELYIKMNSRGKKLTPFEHFKAEYEDLYERDSKESIAINHKFDVEWADTLFNYRDSDNLIDREFMRYFFYISHILCYQQQVNKTNDEFELIKILYRDSPKATENRKFFEDSMDCWYMVKNLYGSIGAFFSKYLSQSTYQQGKVATYKTVAEYRDNQDFFSACIKLYQVNNNFSYSDFLFLYGIIKYLLNQDKIEESAFVERLRILRNLIWNSNSGEIRGDSDYMNDQLKEVDELIINGVIKTDLKHGFNGFQEVEEIEKLKKKLTMSPEEIDRMLKFEDHPLIYGYVSGLGYENLELTDVFYSTFVAENYQNIHRALISVGDYTQFDDSRYYMANTNRSTWTQLLHKSRVRKKFEESMSVILKLLRRVKDGETLSGIRESFTSAQEEQHRFDWRYYFAKYPDMLRGADGELTWDDDNDYICTSLNKHQFNGQHWNPFLNVIYQAIADELYTKYSTRIVSLENYGGNLNILYPISSVALTGNGFEYFFQNDKTSWTVSQTSDGVDQEDRILLAIKNIKEIVERNFAEDARAEQTKKTEGTAEI